VVLLSLGLSTAILVGGIFVLSAAVLVARGFARVERMRLRSMLGKPALSPAYQRAPEGSGLLRRAVTPLKDPQSWLDVLWSLVSFVTGTTVFALVVAWWSAALGGVTFWFWQRWLPEGEYNGLSDLIGLGSTRDDEIWVNLVVGAVALLLLPLVMRFAAALHGGLAHVLLSSRADLQQEVRRVEGGRAAAREAEAASLRRLERDIHDGPQQQLMRLTMDLGRVRKQLAADPALADQILEQALAQARGTVDELRALSRGIAPPLLVDRGLAAALGELTARFTIPVDTDLRVPDHLPPHVETAAYFVVAEALTNIAKHSGAQQAWVRVEQREDDLEVEVGDDGAGGADLAKGSGLAGLEQRVRAADGALELSSPTGGPTILRAVLPLGRA
jgi:signal transduction histidine kinase